MARKRSMACGVSAINLPAVVHRSVRRKLPHHGSVPMARKDVRRPFTGRACRSVLAATPPMLSCMTRLSLHTGKHKAGVVRRRRSA